MFNMKTFKLCEVHNILRDTDFYETLVESYSHDDDISIEERFWLSAEFIEEDITDNMDESVIKKILHVFRFWGVRDPTFAIYHSLTELDVEKRNNIMEIFKDYPDIYKFLNINCRYPTFKLCLGDIAHCTLPAFKYYCSTVDITSDNNVFPTIAQSGNVEMAKYAREIGCKWFKPPNRTYPVNSSVHVAVKHGNYNFMVYAIENGALYYTPKLMRDLVKGGCLQCAKYIVENVKDCIKSYTMSGFVIPNCIKLKRNDMFYMFANAGTHLIPYHYRYAVLAGKKEIVQYMIDKELKIIGNLLPYCESIDMLEFILNIGDENQIMNEECSTTYVLKNLYNLFVYSKEEKNCPWNDETMSRSLEIDDTRYFEYMLKNNYHFTSNLCEYICISGTSDHLKIAIAYGHKVTNRCQLIACVSKNKNCLKYLFNEQGKDKILDYLILNNQVDNDFYDLIE